MEYLNSFLIGGLLCVVAQLLIDKTKLTPAYILVGYICTGVILSTVGLYGPFAEFAYAGASVPLTGFGHLLASGVRRAVDANGLFGALTGGLSAAAAGISATICFAFLFSVLFRSKQN